MDKYLYLPAIDDYAREIIKLAIELPEGKIGTKAKNELFTSSANVSSNYRLACAEKPGEELIDRLNITLQNIGISKFWLDFVKSENLLANNHLANLLSQSSTITDNILQIRNQEKANLEATKSFAGEWLLDD